MRSSLKTSFVLFSILLPPACACSGISAALQAPATDNVPGPFDFREAYLLESRIGVGEKGRQYDPYHSENGLSRTYYGLANQFAQFQADKRDKMSTYQGVDWLTILPETDQYRRMGGLDLAEKQYLDIVKKLREAQGPSSNHLALMLDHLAEFYLEERKFEEAYKTFTEAATVQRQVVNSYSKGGVATPASPYEVSDPSATLKNARLHLSDLLARLGQLDLSNGDLNSANTKLSEAVSIVNSPESVRYTDGLYAVYFLSKLLERQSKWKEAEGLWQETVQLREKFNTTVAYWDSRKEMAACYARHGEFRTAAAIAREVQASIAAKPPNYETHKMLLDNRPRYEQYERYFQESSVAMSEIIAIDTWQTQGADAAATLLKDPIDMKDDDWVLDRGSDAERTKLLAWFQSRVYLHMSILLDGQPSQDRINIAYSLLCKVQGRYLAALSDVTRLIEASRGNPGIQIPDFTILDQLAAVREKQARVFLGAALYGKEFSSTVFAANENQQRVLSNAILSGTGAMSAHKTFSLPMLIKAVPTDAAFVDLFLWDRAEAKAQSRREYGAFVLRNNQTIRYVRLDTAKSIDDDIDALQLRKGTEEQTGQAGTQRAVSVAGKHVDNLPQPLSLEQFQQRSNALYKKMMAPLEPYLEGATRLYIVPDGKLALAPISALQDNSGHYVLESHTITYMESWHDLANWVNLGHALPTSPEIVASPDFSLALYGGSSLPMSTPPLFLALKGAKEEAGDVQSTLKVPDSRVFLGKDARKWLVQSIQNPVILHFATHSDADLNWNPPPSRYALFEYPEALDTQYPLLQSFIALAGANRYQDGPENGILTGLEVESLHLTGTSVVVLSSCKSGQGTLVDGQGVLGLRAAFGTAGANALVMTLWPVDDQHGRQFMKFFYSHLADGPSEAVREAQRDMIARPEDADPFYWSGYVVSEGSVTQANEHAASIRAEKNEPKPTQSSGFPHLLTTENENSFVSPNCFEILTHDDLMGPNYRSFSDIRVKLGGVVRRSEISAIRATYDLRDFGNNVEVSSHQTNVLGSEQVKLASEQHWLMQIIVDKTPDSSSISFRFGPDQQHPEGNRTILLKGSPALFSSLNIPLMLPPLSSYAQAIDSGSPKGGVDKVGFCSAESLVTPEHAKDESSQRPSVSPQQRVPGTVVHDEQRMVETAVPGANLRAEGETASPLPLAGPNTQPFAGNHHLTSIFVEKENRCLESDDGSHPAHMDPCGNFSGQIWTIESAPNGYYRLKSQFQAKNNRCLDSGDLQIAPQMKYCDNSPDQLWKIMPSTTAGYYRLQSKSMEAQDWCLDSMNGAPWPSKVIPCANYSGQFWKILDQ